MLSKVILVSGVLIVMAYLGRNTQVEIVDEIFQNVNTVYFYNEGFLFQDAHIVPYKNKLNTYRDLANESDKVLRISPVSRQQFGYTFVTKCKVIEELESSLDYVENEVYITETAYIENYDTYDLKIMGFLVPMKYEQEYVVFLKKNSGFNKGYYYPLSNTFGIVPLKEQLSIFNDWNQGISLNKNVLNKYDIVYDPEGSKDSSYQSYIDDYIKLFESINEKYKN